MYHYIYSRTITQRELYLLHLLRILRQGVLHESVVLQWNQQGVGLSIMYDERCNKTNNNSVDSCSSMHAISTRNTKDR